jgi:hypothetical protein
MFNASTDRTAVLAGIEPGIRPLIDILESRARPGRARFAVRMRLPEALMSSRRPAVMAMVLAPLRDFAEQCGARMFGLGDGDVVMLLAGPNLLELPRPLTRMLDPIHRAAGPGARPLAVSDLTETWDLNCSEQRLALAGTLSRLQNSAPIDADGNQTSCHQVLGSLALPDLCHRITPALASRCVRRQTVLAIHSAAQMSGLCEDHILDTAEIQRALGCDLAGDPHDAPAEYIKIKEKFEIGIIEALLEGRLELRELPLNVQFTINDASSFLLAEILKKAAAGRLIIDISLTDALAAIDDFERVRDEVRQSGSRVALSVNGIGDATFADLGTLQADFIRFRRRFGSALADGDASCWPATIARLGGDRLIVGDIDDEQRLQYGMELGIRHFSGQYIERLAVKLRQKGVLTP